LKVRRSVPKSVGRSRRAKIRVVELFAGVGGFRLGLEGAKAKERIGDLFETVWANQWEPGDRVQHAADVYRHHFLDEDYPHFNADIEKVVTQHLDSIPDHDLLVGGFPCQDYSVAKTLNQAAGIVGKKGVLWWSIHAILHDSLKKPKYLFLENVDRLLKSPAKQRGRDFAIMLASLANLGYAVEWRVVNAAEYGYPQRRKRVFIIGYRRGTALYKKLAASIDAPYDWIEERGVLAQAFPLRLISREKLSGNFTLAKGVKGPDKLKALTHDFKPAASGMSPFHDAGLMLDFQVWTAKTKSASPKKPKTLRSVLQDPKSVSKEFFVDVSDLKKWEYLKGAKSEIRINKKSGFKYSYDEGKMAYPDSKDKPARTIITAEGGRTPSRFKHIIKDGRRHRRLTPIELERLNGFPDNHTRLDGVSDVRRAFFMGNALVVGLITDVAEILAREIKRSR
jgi:DNA (cytosine-5)-methyltransferase 1